MRAFTVATILAFTSGMGINAAPFNGPAASTSEKFDLANIPTLTGADMQAQGQAEKRDAQRQPNPFNDPTDDLFDPGWIHDSPSDLGLASRENEKRDAQQGRSRFILDACTVGGNCGSNADGEPTTVDPDTRAIVPQSQVEKRDPQARVDACLPGLPCGADADGNPYIVPDFGGIVPATQN